MFIVPDSFTESFQSRTEHGGTDSDGRSLRYLEWTYRNHEHDHLLETEFVYVLKEEDGTVTREFDRESTGLFSKDTWSRLLNDAGFHAYFEPIEHSELEQNSYFGIAAVTM